MFLCFPQCRGWASASWAGPSLSSTFWPTLWDLGLWGSTETRSTTSSHQVLLSLIQFYVYCPESQKVSVEVLSLQDVFKKTKASGQKFEVSSNRLFRRTFSPEPPASHCPVIVHSTLNHPETHSLKPAPVQWQFSPAKPLSQIKTWLLSDELGMNRLLDEGQNILTFKSLSRCFTVFETFFWTVSKGLTKTTTWTRPQPGSKETLTNPEKHQRTYLRERSLWLKGLLSQDRSTDHWDNRSFSEHIHFQKDLF